MFRRTRNNNRAALMPEDSGNEVNRLTPAKAFTYSDALRALETTTLGLGANRALKGSTSLITAISVEGVCAFLNLAITMHQLVQICREMCCRPDHRSVESTNRPPTEYSIYLVFRIFTSLLSFAGIGMIIYDIPCPSASEMLASAIAANNVTNLTMEDLINAINKCETGQSLSTAGLVLMGIGTVLSRTLGASKQQPSGVVLAGDGNYEEDEDDDVEMARVHREEQPRVAANPAPPPPAIPDVVPLEPSSPLATRSAPTSPAGRHNQFFKPDPASPGPAVPAEAPVRKKGTKVKKPIGTRPSKRS